MTKPANLARSPERKRLAEAIGWHRAAADDLARVTEAHQRLDAEFFDRLQPAVAAAQEALAEAREAAPQAIITRMLGEEPSGAATVEKAEAALAECERKLEDARKARSLLAGEAERAEAAVHSARFAHDGALTAAVCGDPAVAALKAEFVAAGHRMLRCAQVLRTAGVLMGGIGAHGLRAVIGEAAVPMGERAFFDDPEWLAAIERLRGDPDAPLPGLPPEDPPDGVGDGSQDRAAA